MGPQQYDDPTNKSLDIWVLISAIEWRTLPCHSAIEHREHNNKLSIKYQTSTTVTTVTTVRGGWKYKLEDNAIFFLRPDYFEK